MTRTIAILVYPDVEVLDLGGPYEVFTTASRMALRMAPSGAAPFRVVTVARQRGPIRARAGLTVVSDHAFDDPVPVDVLVVPGGVVDAELERSDTSAWIRGVDAQTEITASVCTGAFLLARAGCLDGRRATTHWEDVDAMRSMFPHVEVVASDGLRWVDTGKYVTSAGISAGIDMSLHLVERLAGRALAERTARQMDFAWTENSASLGGGREGR